MSDEQSSVVTLKVRVSPEFREKIVNTAKQNNRSMNQEIVGRLEQSFEKDEASEFDREFVLQVIKNQQDQIDQLQDMVKQLVVRPREAGE
jgi:hypothetical protein